ncbi:MAG: VCBS repeat-containing protein, partial [Planctomycetes bacterium]|nr:VCBS repeat-containing protein [Planctomycetota bacterium]
MKNPWRSVRALVAAALLLGLPACGAGLITGVAASGGGSESRPPELLLAPVLPLVPAANTTRTVVITNAQLSAAAQVRVRLQALGETVDQLAPQISVQSGSTAITFGVATGLIAKAAVDPSAADVDALLTVLVDGRPIGSTVPVLLVRQPRAELDLAPGTARFVSPFGEAVTVRVGALRDFGSVEMFVATRDPDNAAADGGPATLIRPCTNVEAVPTGTPGEAMVTGTLPGNSFPDQADVFVRDASAGESTAVRVYYEPAITLALPSQGITTGGNLVTLIGTALVPHDFGQMPAPLQFDAVEFAFQKGNRRIELGREDFRAELSAGDRLVFRMPSSPDGRPGQVDIVLRVQLEGVVAEVVASQVFLFASPHPFFGPRGAALDRFPVAVAPIPLDGAPAGGDAPDFAVLSEESGVAYLQLLLAQENGMFLRFGARRRIGDPEVPAERNPADLCSADFDGDDVPDLFVVNSGAAMAVHHIVLGQAKPKTPLGGVFQVPGIGGMAHCRTGRFDGDELEDVLLVPGPAADPQQRPQLLLSRPYFDPSTERVVPAFAQPIDVPVGAMSYQAVEVADLDGDGFLDVAVVDGVQLELDIAYGRGDGTFENAVPLVVTVPGYTPDPGSPAVGLHACGNGPQQSLGLVLGGDNDGVGADPQALVAVLHQSSPRVFGQPLGSDIRGLGSDPVGASVIANIDRTEALELVVGIRNELLTGPAAVAVFYYRGPDFFPLSGGVEVGGEQPRKVRGLHFGRAFAANPSGGGLAVFAVHESDVDGVPERRLSTFLVFDDGVLPTTLLAPDGGRHRDTPIGAIIGGNWSARAVAGHGAVRDLAVVRNDDSTGVPSIEILENDGFGGFPIPGELIAVPGIVPPTLALLPAPEDEIEALVFVDESSRLGFWRPRVAGAFTLTNELRLASP